LLRTEPSRAGTAGASFESVGKLMGVAQLLRYSATDAQRATASETLNETRRALHLILVD
jgi:hypothetical protein